MGLPMLPPATWLDAWHEWRGLPYWGSPKQRRQQRRRDMQRVRRAWRVR